MRIVLFALLASCIFLHTYSQPIPEGYLLQYQQDFSNSKSLSDFTFNRPWLGSIAGQGKHAHLTFIGSDTLHMFPVNMAVIKNKVFGDFILEAEVPALKNNAENDGCLFLGIRDSSKYYFIQLTQRDSAGPGIFLVRDSVITPLAVIEESTDNFTATAAYKIRLERNIVKRTIKVFINNMDTPLLMARDYELVMGSLGFGSISGSARFDNIKIWAPTVITDAQLKEMYGK